MPQSPFSFMPPAPAGNIGAFQQGLFGAPKGTTGLPGAMGAVGPRPLPGQRPALGGGMPTPMSGPPAPPPGPPGFRPNPFMAGSAGPPPMPSQSPFTGSPLGMGGGSNALFNAMRNMRALEQQAAPLSMQQVLRFFSPEETSIASFRPEPKPPAPAQAQQSVSRPSNTRDGGDAAGNLGRDSRDAFGGRDFGQSGMGNMGGEQGAWT